MAHFLLATGAGTGQVYPMLPISRALVERGHQVVWITGKKYQRQVEATGATFYPLPETVDPGEKDIYEWKPELKKLHGMAQLKWYMKNGFIGASPEVIKAVDAVLSEYHADVLVGDIPMQGLFYKSELTGIPSALVSMSPLAVPSRDTAPYGLALLPRQGTLARIRNRLLNWLSDNIILRDVNVYENKIRRQLGLPPRNSYIRGVFEFPDLMLQFTVPSFEYLRSDQPANLRFTGPILPKPDRVYTPPAWWSDLSSGCPVIMITQGTMETEWQELIIPTIDSLKQEDVLMVAVPFEAYTIENLPKQLRAEKFIPFDQLLPHVDVLVTNGGYGGVQQALAHGIPLVVAASQTEDHMEVGARVEWSGAGIHLRKLHPSPSEIREAVKQVLNNPKYRENAGRIQRDYAKYNGPQCAAELLESLVTKRV